MKRLADLPAAAQQHLLENLEQFPVYTDVSNMMKFIRYQGESIAYASVESAQLLNG